MISVLKKNVLFVINSELANAGVPNVVMQIVRNLHEVCQFDIVLGNAKQGYFDEEFESFGGEIIRLDLADYSQGKLRFTMRGRQVYDAVNEVLGRKQYDIIHCHNGIESGPALKAAYKHGVPTRISHSHGTYLIKGKNVVSRIYKRTCMRMGVKYSTARLACSDIAGKTLFLNREFVNILNPVDLSLYQNNAKVEHEGIRLIQIGYYNDLKNQLFSLEVLKNIIDSGVEAYMDFIGYEISAGYLAHMKNKIEEYKLSERVRLLPSDYDKAEVLAQSDFLLLPSRSEGLPLVALEAQAANVYCVASDKVTYDVDMGMFTRLGIDKEGNPKKWAEWVIRNQNYTKRVSTDKLKNVDVGEYMKKIEKSYNMSQNSGGGTL